VGESPWQLAIRIGSAGSAAEPFKLQSRRKNAQAAASFVILKMSPATHQSAVAREILIRSFNGSAVAGGHIFISLLFRYEKTIVPPLSRFLPMTWTAHPDVEQREEYGPGKNK